jgi:curved DNA-binding protein CbpA
MWDSIDREKYFKLNKINPYIVLGVSPDDKDLDLKKIKKKYKKLALSCHPDKTGGKTTTQFRILRECYLYIEDELTINTVQQKRPQTLEEYKNERNADSLMHVDTTYRNLYNTNFEDEQTRSKLFVDDDIKFSKIDEIIKEKQSLGTVYQHSTKEHIPKRNIFSKNKKFNIKHFNEVFDACKKEIQEKNKIKNDSKCKTITSLSDKKILDEDSVLGKPDLAEIIFYNDIIIDKKTENTGNFAKLNQDEDGIQINELTDKQIKKILKKYKKNKNQNIEEVSALLEREKKLRSEPVQNDNNYLTFTEATIKLQEEKMKNSLDQMRKNKEYIKEKIKIYPEKFRMLL